MTLWAIKQLIWDIKKAKTPRAELVLLIAACRFRSEPRKVTTTFELKRKRQATREVSVPYWAWMIIGLNFRTHSKSFLSWRKNFQLGPHTDKWNSCNSIPWTDNAAFCLFTKIMLFSWTDLGWMERTRNLSLEPIFVTWSLFSKKILSQQARNQKRRQQQ